MEENKNLIRTFWGNGNIQSEGRMENGKKFGPWKWWFEKGQYNGFIDENGLCEIYNDKGILTNTGHMKNGKKEGLWKNFTDDGFLRQEVQFVNGKEHGFFREHFESEKYKLDYNKREGHYKDGKQEGSFKLFHKNGIILEVNTYVNGYSHGPHKLYYSNGQLKSEGIYIDDRKHGVWKFYYMNNQLEKIGRYDYKNRIGTRGYVEPEFIPEKCWDEKGNEIECKIETKVIPEFEWNNIFKDLRGGEF